MYSTAGMFVVRGDSPARSIADLKGKPVAFGAAGSGLVILARYVLDGIGLDMERDFQAIYLERAGDGPAMVLDGRAAALWGGGIGWPGFTNLAEKGGRFIAPDADEANRIQAKHSFLKPLTVPAGAYPEQNAPIQSVGSWSFILARPDLPGDTGYRLAKALHEGERRLAEKLDQAKETTAANTARPCTHSSRGRALFERDWRPLKPAESALDLSEKARGVGRILRLDAVEREKPRLHVPRAQTADPGVDHRAQRIAQDQLD
jgi:uncharacterized protein